MAGHSKRKLTSRRVNKRMDNKRYRAAERQVISGGHSRLVRYDKWSLRPRQPLLDDDNIADNEEMSYPGPDQSGARPDKRNKQKRKAKNSPYCPAREGQKHHHFLTDTREVPNWPGFGPVYEHPLSPAVAAHLGVRYHTEVYKLCAYCGEERIVRRRRDR